MHKSFHSIAITGASSGLGKALALHYAAAGTTLHLTGRDQTRLREVVRQCEAKGAHVYGECINVTDEAAMTAWLTAQDAITPIDLVIANAGISAGTSGGDETPAQAKRIFDTNLYGVLHTIDPLIPHMRKRGSGHIAIISSMASFRGLPTAPAYSTSKGAVRLYGEALRGWLGTDGIGVSVVCPGFIETPMTDVNPFPMPLLMPAEKAALRIADGLAKNKARIAFPRRLYVATRLMAALPQDWANHWLTKVPGKPAETCDTAQ